MLDAANYGLSLTALDWTYMAHVHVNGGDIPATDYMYILACIGVH